MRVFKAVAAAFTLVVVAAGCSSTGGQGEQWLTGQQENYCGQLGAWQRVRNEAGTGTPDSSGYDEAEAAAKVAFLAVQPLRDEAVGGGRTVGEATAAAMKHGDAEAEGLVVKYCEDAGFETLTR